MAKVLIDMPNSFIKEHIENYEQGSLVDIAVRTALKHGIVLDGLTNGEVIQKMFPQMTVVEELTYAIVVKLYKDGFCLQFDLAWWNAKWGE